MSLQAQTRRLHELRSLRSQAARRPTPDAPWADAVLGAATADPGAHLPGLAEAYGVSPLQAVGALLRDPTACRRVLVVTALRECPLCSYRAIGAALATSHTTVTTIAREAGLSRTRGHVSAQQAGRNARIRTAHQQGATVDELRQRFRLSRTRILQIVAEDRAEDRG